MATIYRAYRTRDNILRYRTVTLYCTILLIAVLIAAHELYGLVPLLVTIYLTWSPWHYMGQNFGLMMMFIHRNELKVSRKSRQVLWMAFIASFILLFLRIHTAPSIDPFMISLGLSPSILDALRIPLTAVFFAGLVPLAILIRQAGWKPMLASLTLYTTQFLWAVLPTVLRFVERFGVPQVSYSIAILAAMHCAQYLWITQPYARQEAKAESKSWHWQSYFVVLVIGGIALLIPGPWIASYALGRDFALSVLIFTAVVNIHHFIVDGAIWKLRDTRNRSLLTTTEAGGTETPVGRWWKPVWRPARIAGIAAIALLLMIAGIDQVRYYAGSGANDASNLALAATLNPHDSILQMRLARAYDKTGDRADMEHAIRESIKANPDNLEGQNALARLLIETGRYPEAYAHYKQMFFTSGSECRSAHELWRYLQTAQPKR
jgi:hypothetical protein